MNSSVFCNGGVKVRVELRTFYDNFFKSKNDAISTAYNIPKSCLMQSRLFYTPNLEDHPALILALTFGLSTLYLPTCALHYAPLGFCLEALRFL